MRRDLAVGDLINDRPCLTYPTDIHTTKPSINNLRLIINLHKKPLIKLQ